MILFEADKHPTQKDTFDGLFMVVQLELMIIGLSAKPIP